MTTTSEKALALKSLHEAPEILRVVNVWDAVSAKVHALALSFGGSISAEHGIGQMKRDELAAIRAPIEIDLMQRIKAAFDPAGIMNPGKVLRTR